MPANVWSSYVHHLLPVARWPRMDFNFIHTYMYVHTCMYLSGLFLSVSNWKFFCCLQEAYKFHGDFRSFFLCCVHVYTPPLPKIDWSWYTNTYVCTYNRLINILRIHAYTHTFYVRTCIFTYTCIYTHIVCTCTYMYVHTPTHTHTYVNTHTHT